jgi:hypothetical protein
MKANPVAEVFFVSVRSITAPGDVPAGKVRLYIAAAQGQQGPQDNYAENITGRRHPGKARRAGTPERPHQAKFQRVVPGVGHHYKGPAAQGNPAQNPVTKMPGRRLDTRPPALAVPGNFSRGNMYNPAGNVKGGAEGLYRHRIPPAFPGRTDAMLHMDNPQDKSAFRIP